MKTLIQAVIGRIGGGVRALRYIDKDWGQLQMELSQSPVKFPALLADVTEVSYTQYGEQVQMAEPLLTLTVANVRTVPSNPKGGRMGGSFETLDIVDSVHALLQNWSDGSFTPLERVSMHRVTAGAGAEVYEISYRTSKVTQ